MYAIIDKDTKRIICYSGMFVEPQEGQKCVDIGNKRPKENAVWSGTGLVQKSEAQLEALEIEKNWKLLAKVIAAKKSEIKQLLT
jgi:hypothetical protein